MALHAECLRAAPCPLPWAVLARVAHPCPKTAVSPHPCPSLRPHVGPYPFLATPAWHRVAAAVLPLSINLPIK